MAQLLLGSKGQEHNGIDFVSIGKEAKIKMCFKWHGVELAKYEPWHKITYCNCLIWPHFYKHVVTCLAIISISFSNLGKIQTLLRCKIYLLASQL